MPLKGHSRAIHGQEHVQAAQFGCSPHHRLCIAQAAAAHHAGLGSDIGGAGLQVSMAGQASHAGLLEDGTLGTPHGPLRQPVFRPHTQHGSSPNPSQAQQAHAKPAQQHADPGPSHNPSTFQDHLNPGMPADAAGTAGSPQHTPVQHPQDLQQAGLVLASSAPLGPGHQTDHRPPDQQLQHRASTNNLAGPLAPSAYSQQLKGGGEDDANPLFRQTSVVYSSNVDGTAAPVSGQQAAVQAREAAGRPGPRPAQAVCIEPDVMQVLVRVAMLVSPNEGHVSA